VKLPFHEGVENKIKIITDQMSLSLKIVSAGGICNFLPHQNAKASIPNIVGHSDVISITDGVEATKTNGKKTWEATINRNLLWEVDELRMQMNYFIDSYATPRVINCAVQILLFLIERQPLTPTPTSNHFETNRNINVLQCINELGFTSDAFARKADALINERNSILHFQSIEGLKIARDEALKAIESFPIISRRNAFAVFVIENFQIIERYLQQI